MDATPKVLLIDLENCPTQIQQLKVDLDHFLQIVICYAHSQAKIPLSWLNELAEAIQQNKLRVIQMAQAGKNSADFGLAFFAGVLMQEHPVETEFIIVSNDKDLDHVVHLLKAQKRVAQRIGAVNEEPTKPAIPNHPNPSKPAVPQNVLLICQALLHYPDNRPRKRESLQNFMLSRLLRDNDAMQTVYQILVSLNVITVSEEKITYHDAALKKLSNELFRPPL